jgi:hypothetical protein
MTSLLEGYFSLKSSEEITFDSNLELTFKISQDLKKCFEYDLQKISIFYRERSDKLIWFGTQLIVF